jgi:hypothetical protein
MPAAWARYNPAAICVRQFSAFVEPHSQRVERSPGDVLHRDVVDTVLLADVVDSAPIQPTPPV